MNLCGDDPLSVTETVNPAIDPAHFRHVRGHFCSGITIISSHVDSKPIGLTCQSFFSVSLEPPLVAFAVGCGSSGVI